VFACSASLRIESYPQMSLTRRAPRFLNPAAILVVFVLSPALLHLVAGLSEVFFPLMFVLLKIADFAPAVRSSAYSSMKWDEPWTGL
jgi:hypothetical protein